MHNDVLPALIGLLALGAAAQWLAWRLRLPSILVLLLVGVLVGPVFELLEPDKLLGELLFPVVSIAVAVVLFDGGLSLRFREFRRVGGAVTRLVTLGVLLTWGLTTAASYWLLEFDFGLSLLIGAMLVVTGPTVITPLLRQVRPRREVSSLLKWEGIINDPLGAILAVLIFEALHAGQLKHAATQIPFDLLLALGAGVLCGLVGAGAMIVSLRRYWIPDVLENPVILMTVLLVFLAGDLAMPEAGLMAVTVMGLILANQPWAEVRHIIEFKESLGTFLVSVLFILLAARLEPTDLQVINPRTLLFIAVLIVFVRPAAVFLSTLGTKLSWRGRTFVACIAPRGVVAAAIASVFALRLEQTGYEQADALMPIVFLVILGTIAVYGLGAWPLVRWLCLVDPNPQGVLFVGADQCGRALAGALRDEGIRVVLLDTRSANAHAAREQGLEAHKSNVLIRRTFDDLELVGLGSALVITPNDEANALAALHLQEIFERKAVFQLSPETPTEAEGADSQLEHGRRLFERNLTYGELARRIDRGWTVETVRITDEFTFEQFNEHFDERVRPLFVVDSQGRLSIATVNRALEPETGDTLIYLQPPEGQEEDQHRNRAT